MVRNFKIEKGKKKKGKEDTHYYIIQREKKSRGKGDGTPLASISFLFSSNVDSLILIHRFPHPTRCCFSNGHHSDFLGVYYGTEETLIK